MAIPDLNDISGAILGTMYKLGYFRKECLQMVAEKKSAKCEGLFLSHAGKATAMENPKMITDVVTMIESYSSSESQLRSKYLTCLEVALGERFSLCTARRQIESLLKKYSNSNVKSDNASITNPFAELNLDDNDEDEDA